MSDMPNPHDIEYWLYRNLFDQDATLASWHKVVTRGVLTLTTIDLTVLREDIFTDGANVIKRVERWHMDNGIFYHPWPWADEDTRKIELDDFLGKAIDTCDHERGVTPLTNEKNELWVICKKCGKDLERIG